MYATTFILSDISLNLSAEMSKVRSPNLIKKTPHMFNTNYFTNNSIVATGICQNFSGMLNSCVRNYLDVKRKNFRKFNRKPVGDCWMPIQHVFQKYKWLDSICVIEFDTCKSFLTCQYHLYLPLNARFNGNIWN